MDGAGEIPLKNLFADLPRLLTNERFDLLVDAGRARLERIVSTGHATPRGQWLDQDRTEWVAVLRGQASLRFEDESEPRVLGPGDYVLIQAHRRHRVEWTDPGEPTIWLAFHY